MESFTTQGCLLHLDLHTQQIALLPTSRGVVNSSSLAVYKGSTQEIKVELKVKTESKLKCKQ